LRSLNRPLSFLHVYSASEELAEFELIGQAMTLMAQSHFHSRLPISYVRAVLWEAVQQEKIKFYHNSIGRMVGFVIWASLSDQVARRLVSTRRLRISRDEWDSGTRKFIMDFIAPCGNVHYILRDLRDSVFRLDHAVWYARPKFGSLIFKEISRDSKSSFFQETFEGKDASLHQMEST
jgi:hemolysin-activating ACP:hemolysin acyltransferase